MLISYLKRTLEQKLLNYSNLFDGDHLFVDSPNSEHLCFSYLHQHELHLDAIYPYRNKEF